ncbi:10649_t:CDS:2 [Funneliformis geosporum]|uniref:10649_t:CDS:1 n=1 Tax=Funneliformis geosporum TaxID=1117311 RepID=A0A9W4SM95_9GLOM|nr:10649_t:CDS:2 [Funneliformis geosporum]
MNGTKNMPIITDLGIYQPANLKPTENDKKQVFGVLPYLAPEILKGKNRTQASDIYGFGIIAYEITTGLPPFYDMAHEELLATRICQGLRPKTNYKVPQKILDIIKQCLDADPLKRPNALKLSGYSEKGKVNVTNSSSNLRPFGTLTPIPPPPRIRNEPNLQQANVKDHENWLAKQQERISILQQNVELQKHLRELSTTGEDHEKWLKQEEQRIDVMQRQIEFQKQLNELYLAIPQLTNDDEYEKWMERQQERIRVLKQQVELQQQLYELSNANMNYY